MIHKKKSYLFIGFSLLVGFFFILDRYLKNLVQISPHQDWGIFKWGYFENDGIAFGINIPSTITIIFTPIILILLLGFTIKQKNKISLIGFFLVFFGAISNLYDRIMYDFVIDYFHIVTSVINIADCMIVLGIFFLFYKKKKKLL